MLENYGKYFGKTIISNDVVCSSQVQRMSVTLDRNDKYPEIGDPVPSGWNYIFFPNLVCTKDLAEDGTISDNAFAVKTDLPLRWLAGSRAKYHRPMLIGDRITQVSEIVSVQPKKGRTGELLFVTQRQTISNEDDLLMEEEWDVVYREAVEGGTRKSTGEPAPQAFSWEKTVCPDTSFLFRFSALNFNPRRLHYDYDYATRVEGLPGLVVHGPLTAILLMELARDNGSGRRLASFSMRAKLPVLANQPLKLLGQPTSDGTACELWAVLPDNTVAMSADATFADL